MNNNAVVSLLKTKNNPSVRDLETSLESLLELLGGIKSFVSSGTRVLLKPNVGTAAGVETGTVTDYRVVEALVNLLYQAGAEQVTIAEASAVGQDTTKAFAAAGYDAVARRTGVRLVDLKSSEITDQLVPHSLVFDRIRVFSHVLEYDLFINIPTLKTIFSVPVSLGMKNLKGVIPDSEKRRFHHVNLNKAIVDLNTVIRPHLSIVDGIIGSELYKPKAAGILLAGTDIQAVDTIASLAMGIDPGTVEYLQMASQRELGITDPGRIIILGDELDRVKQRFERAEGSVKGFKHRFPEVEIAEGAACSGCIYVLNYALQAAKNQGLLEKCQGITFAIGPEAKPAKDKRVIYLGNCLNCHKDKEFIPGCPFISMELLDYLIRHVAVF